MKTKSILSTHSNRCFLCGSSQMLEKHHVFGGAYRSKSEKLGMTVHLCHNCHNEPPKGVHHNAEMNRQLKARAQRKAMEYYGWSVEDFINMFGKNYLEYGRENPLRELWEYVNWSKNMSSSTRSAVKKDVSGM